MIHRDDNHFALTLFSTNDTCKAFSGDLGFVLPEELQDIWPQNIHADRSNKLVHQLHSNIGEHPASQM